MKQRVGEKWSEGEREEAKRKRTRRRFVGTLTGSVYREGIRSGVGAERPEEPRLNTGQVSVAVR